MATSSLFFMLPLIRERAVRPDDRDSRVVLASPAYGDPGTLSYGLMHSPGGGEEQVDGLGDVLVAFEVALCREKLIPEALVTVRSWMGAGVTDDMRYAERYGYDAALRVRAPAASVMPFRDVALVGLCRDQFAERDDLRPGHAFSCSRMPEYHLLPFRRFCLTSSITRGASVLFPG